MDVLICGGGVIGASIAYFLSCRGVKATVIEGTGLACAASGKSGGFLARDWCDGSPLAPMARRSFALHAELAERIADNWGYRRLDTYGGFAGFARQRSRHDLGWLSAEVTIGQILGSPETTAQVHPGQFTAAMMHAAEAQGAELRCGRVTGIAQYAGRAIGVEVDGEIVEGDAVVIAMGPWSILAARWLPLPAVFGLKGHSLVFDTGTAVPSQAVFLEYRERNGAVQSPELFPRDDGTTYICAILQRRAIADRPGSGCAGAGRDRTPRNDVRGAVAGTRLGGDPGTAGVLPPGDIGRAAVDRGGARRRRRLCRHRAQRLGHSQRAGDRRGGIRVDRRRGGAYAGFVAVRSRPAAASRSRAAPQ